jgi:hypothetical protein
VRLGRAAALESARAPHPAEPIDVIAETSDSTSMRRETTRRTAST